LKPGGVFVFADLRLTEDWTQIESDLASTSLVRDFHKRDILFIFKENNPKRRDFKECDACFKNR